MGMGTRTVKRLMDILLLFAQLCCGSVEIAGIMDYNEFCSVDYAGAVQVLLFNIGD